MLLAAAVVVLVWLERRGRDRSRYANLRSRGERTRPRVTGIGGWLRTAMRLPLLFGFVLPALAAVAPAGAATIVQRIGDRRWRSGRGIPCGSAVWRRWWW